MRKIKSIPVYLLLFALCSIFVVSCSEENTVTTPSAEPYQFDSARYIWSFKSFNTEFFTFEAFDTTNIFLLGVQALVKYDGNNFNNNYYGDNSFDPLAMDSYDKNNIYIGGHNNSITNYGLPRLKKWNGITFEEIPIPDPSDNRYQISAIYAVKKDELLMGSTRGDLIHYKAGSFEFLRIDTTFIFTMFGTDEMGNLYTVSQKTAFDSLTTNYLNIYKKVDNTWEWTLVFSEKYTGYDINEIQPSSINFEISGFKNNNIVKFNVNTFQEIFNIKPFNAYPVNQLSDTSINFFLMPGKIINGGFGLFHWNGIKWSKEINFPEIYIFDLGFRKIENIDGKYFVLCFDTNSKVIYFGKGIKKFK